MRCVAVYMTVWCIDLKTGSLWPITILWKWVGQFCTVIYWIVCARGLTLPCDFAKLIIKIISINTCSCTANVFRINTGRKTQGLDSIYGYAWTGDVFSFLQRGQIFLYYWGCKVNERNSVKSSWHCFHFSGTVACKCTLETKCQFVFWLVTNDTFNHISWFHCNFVLPWRSSSYIFAIGIYWNRTFNFFSLKKFILCPSVDVMQRTKRKEELNEIVGFGKCKVAVISFCWTDGISSETCRWNGRKWQARKEKGLNSRQGKLIQLHQRWTVQGSMQGHS